MKTNSIRFNTIWCLLLTLFVAISCKNETGVEPIYDGIKMRVSLSSGFTVATGNSGASKSKASTSVATKNTDGKLETQTQIIPLSNGLNIVAKLVPEQQTAPVALKQSAGGGLKAAAQEVRNELPEDTQYRLLVYNATGNEVKRFDKTVDGNGSSFDEFTLDATGETTTYTFVAYSAGTAALPALAPNSTLSSAMVTIGNEKVMHFVETVALGYGANDLEVVLANKLSEITTVLDGRGIGLNSITGVGNFTLKNATHNGGSLKLSDGTVTYTGSAQDKAVSFPAISTGLAEVSSLPTVLARDLTTTSLEVEYIEIAGLGRSESFVVPNVKIEPGVKYNLVLELNKGNCMSDGIPQNFSISSANNACRLGFICVPFLGCAFNFYAYNFNENQCNGSPLGIIAQATWTTPGNGALIGSTHEFVPSTTNEGAVINITGLNKAFDVRINDPSDEQNNNNYTMTTKTLQSWGAARTLEFTDGTFHANENAVAAITGTVDSPVLRVTISKTGVVSIEGRRNNTDQTLYPMQLTNSTSFRSLTWYVSGTTNNNKITVSQTVSGVTRINGQIVGKTLGPCQP